MLSATANQRHNDNSAVTDDATGNCRHENAYNWGKLSVLKLQNICYVLFIISTSNISVVLQAVYLKS